MYGGKYHTRAATFESMSTFSFFCDETFIGDSRFTIQLSVGRRKGRGGWKAYF